MRRTGLLLASMVATVLVAGSVVAFLHAAAQPRAAQAAGQPNIVFVYADDQDVGTMRFMPNVQEELAANGVTFENAFATTPLCCPTRTTFLRGQYSHNTEVTSNPYPWGGYQKFLEMGYDKDHLGVWLQAGGYATGHVGKLMNGWAETKAGPPPGFDYFVGNNEAVHSDDVRKKAVGFVKDRAPEAQPFYLSVSPLEPHYPFWFPLRYADLY